MDSASAFIHSRSQAKHGSVCWSKAAVTDDLTSVLLSYTGTHTVYGDDTI